MSLNKDLLDMLVPSKYGEVYSKLSKERVIFISEDITKEVASSFSAMLLHYDNISEDDITIYINTNGGDAAALANMYDIMQMIKSQIRTICIGKAYSAGAVLLSAGTKGKRFITKNADVMIHGVQFGFPLDSKTESENYFKFLEEENKSILQILVKHTGKTMDQIVKDCSRDFYLNSKNAVEYGIVDQVL